ncbi:hypothetical protein G7054_g14699 [Neopestalotiopsis clavispora]|nr:hypothetical protein G7054_g14699 [Neopestalotiopsis clavispora]
MTTISSLQPQPAIDESLIERFVSLLKKWLEQCDAHHDDRCKIIPISERPPWQIPDWVIDAQEGCIVPGYSVQRYAALSYVWELPSQQSGQATSDRLMLRSDNVEAFQKPGFLSTGGMTGVPIVVKDSLDLILQAGIRYLWVDCLCIVQHAETTRSRVEAMKEIYSGACVTIIAATTSGGLFVSKTADHARGKSGGRPRRPRHRLTNYSTYTDAQSLYGSLLASHWASRGWTFQEQMLSKRSINFIDDTTFWSCECSVWWTSSAKIKGVDEYKRRVKGTSGIDRNESPAFMVGEDTLGIASHVHHSVEVNKHRELSHALKSPSIPNLRLYVELICRYNHRNLTYSQDALPAFSGVLQSVTQGSSSAFVCGLPVVFLDDALLWQPLRKARRRVSKDTGRYIAPPAPLPSWSWVGWQCLIDPESMVSGLDYEVKEVINGTSVPHQSSWRTSKLVDWYALSDKDQSPGTLLREHQLMDSCKELQKNPYARDLPEGWSRKSAFEFVNTSEVAAWQNQKLGWQRGNWQRRRAGIPEKDYAEPASKPITWFSHGGQENTWYRYPIPTGNTYSPAYTSVSDAAFLSCTTTMAHFNIRRMLCCQGRDRFCHADYLIGFPLYTVRKTTIYMSEPAHKDCNSVITLEDGCGRWAGLLKVMDEETTVEIGEAIQLIAISKGSASRREAAGTYEASVDIRGMYSLPMGAYHTNPSYYVFAPSTGDQPRSAEIVDDGVIYSMPWGWEEDADDSLEKNESQEIILHPEPLNSENFKRKETRGQQINVDLGPLNSKSIDPNRWSEWGNETYSFYNVLWVETRDGVMYRKAAGRISEDIWEQTCGAPQRIVLG